ncbi:DUF2259 domain-containing protein [Oceanispirochaeta crateris]|jgi:predicted secreted protein|uniref:DUF2259 domain-containing protein n=1 Tax=Oceanispirochaeta crateris TaxID=2518645 RepID=A0A5C1QNJ0_9SPIO|nr:DUF2259 domain-containing protein [Oceanispirochaeta crateris]QEN09097.1 DUF2259 domain-containing protein [Oceanispirochaeta crateris]
MKKKLLTVTVMILLIMTEVYAGDKAEFVNMGFSPDGSYFLFGQYGFAAEKTQCYADIYLVDVRNNKFVPASVFSGEYTATLEPGQSPDGALFSLLETAIPARKKYNIDYLKKGRPLYIRISDTDESMDVLDFRDFETGSRFSMKLIQDAVKNEDGQAVESSFFIEMTFTGSGGVNVPFVIGHPDFKRKGIEEYRIERVLTDPSNKSIIIIVAKIDNDLNVRYMVETVRIR